MATDYSTITSSTIQPNPAMSVVAPTPDTTNYGGITTGIANSVGKTFDSLKLASDKGDKVQSDLSSEITSIMGGLTSKAGDEANANETAGVNSANADIAKYTTQLSDLNSEASRLFRESQAIPIQVQENNVGTGATDRGVAPQTTSALRNNALKALSIGQQADIASANLTGSQIRLQSAKDKAKQIVDLKYKPIEDSLAIRTKQYEMNKDILASIDKKRAEALGVALDKEKTELADKKAQEKTIQDMIINASSANAPANLLASAKLAKTPTEVATILGEYAGDYYKTMLLKKQIEGQNLTNAKLKTENTTANNLVNKPIIDAYVANIQREPTKYKITGVPAKYKDAVQLALASASANATSNSPAVQGLKQTVSNIESLIDSNGLSLAVGTAPLGRQDVLSGFRSDRQDFVAGVQQLISTKTLDTLINLKSQGGTLGALSDQERVMLQSSASKIGSWAIPDPANPGKILGYNTSEESFKKELETLKTLTNKAISNAGGSVSVEDNPFTQALNGGQTPIPGTAIIKSVSNDGAIDFTIPK